MAFPLNISLVFLLASTIAVSHAFVVRTSSTFGSGSTHFLASPSTTTSLQSSLLSVTLEKPLGVILEEVEQGQAKGVFVLELAEDGSAAASEFKDRLVGLPLANVMGNDVTGMDFDSVMDQLIAAPSPITLDFKVATASEASGESESPLEDDLLPIGTIVAIKVLDNNGNPETIVEGKVGDNLRATLLENKIEVYKGLKQKLGNCGGGGQCTFCAANFIESEGWSERSEYEDQRLAKAPQARLTCLNNIQGPATIRLV
uniref:2Fe-2S ferredoxin-type domain-containing protein n=1 Tax=Pseudo-nitzschia australis TaxID=44445 RepID=A0A7S4AQV8_9STRA|mmetsp:Transcript_103/g.274  ORF Transcript_103/g.274 Transcript_103/m.274 type:complete len:258 (+) Transcript_103:106-879(+)|eukprot:CAMPEP_0168192084 /NCGR_PEP_ID=MMETSP0139_2-20121125/17857_1 /TAXON_ID=44445 /ORGANISM="Pseudo-nitzschia australis, Strain 10249 10 AB" /LENGTH=257 /DNA_ID=CAMNT_0008115295 /DNA_START=38 /DNA_END=811 /DNA_ORIENTATION=-